MSLPYRSIYKTSLEFLDIINIKMTALLSHDDMMHDLF